MSRGLNINNANSNSNLMSTADLGGQRILGMSGSLTNWINTGVATPLDSFSRSQKNNPKEKNKKFDIAKALKIAVITLGLAAGGVLLFKNKAKIGEIFSNLTKKADTPKKPTTSKQDGFFGKLAKDIKKAYHDYMEQCEKEAAQASNKNASQAVNEGVQASISSTPKIKTKQGEVVGVSSPQINQKGNNLPKLPKPIIDAKKGSGIKKPKAPVANGTNPIPLYEKMPDYSLKALPPAKTQEELIETSSKVINSSEAPLKPDNKVSKKQSKIAKMFKSLFAKKKPVIVQEAVESAPSKGIVVNKAASQAASEPKKETLQKASELAKQVQVEKPIQAQVVQETLNSPPKLETVKPFSDSEMEELKILCGFDEAQAVAKKQVPAASSVAKKGDVSKKIDSSSKTPKTKSKNIEKPKKQKTKITKDVAKKTPQTQPKDEVQQIIDEAKTWKNLPLDEDDFETAFDKSKKAMDAKPGEALSILETAKPIEQSHYHYTPEEAHKMAKELQERHRSVVSSAQEGLSDEAFEMDRYLWKQGDAFEIYDPLTGEKYGMTYRIGLDGKPEPIEGDLPVSKKVIIRKNRPKREELQIKPDVSMLSHQNLRPVESLSEAEIEDIKILCGDVDLSGIDQEKLLDEIRPRFSFAQYIEGKKANPEFQRYKREMLEERMEELKYYIKTPKRTQPKNQA
ncbi:MAG: hypothetical protein IJB79_07545 [Candidatus Gastranaerophilales bacterium]|nr:hypothetical protein [Candidatus Gastranaerophilales bacterium]